MIEIKFQGNSMENIIRQIQAFIEKVELKGERKRGRHEKKDQTDSGCDAGL